MTNHLSHLLASSRTRFMSILIIGVFIDHCFVLLFVTLIVCVLICQVVHGWRWVLSCIYVDIVKATTLFSIFCGFIGECYWFFRRTMFQCWSWVRLLKMRVEVWQLEVGGIKFFIILLCLLWRCGCVGSIKLLILRKMLVRYWMLILMELMYSLRDFKFDSRLLDHDIKVFGKFRVWGRKPIFRNTGLCHP